MTISFHKRNDAGSRKYYFESPNVDVMQNVCFGISDCVK